jgi:putative ABC transport system permease protein
MDVMWRKVLSDLRSNKARTLLTTLTVAVGVFAVGFVMNMQEIMSHDLDVDYQAGNPHGAIVYCAPFDGDLLPAVRQVPGIGQGEGRSELTARILAGAERKVSVVITAIPPVEDVRIDRLRPNTPGETLALSDREIMIERSALGALPFEPGDMVRVELPDGTVRELRLVTFVRDPSRIPYTFTNYAVGFVTQETMVWLGGSWDYNRLLITVAENRRDEEHVTEVAQAVAERIKDSGREVYQTFVYKPGRHFASDIGQATTAILGILGTMIVLLSGFLVLSTVMSLLGQHVRQIGIMKAVGGRTLQIAGMYIGMVLIFGVLSLLATVPLSAIVAYRVSQGLGQFLNFELQPFRFSTSAVLLQLGVALVAPVAAASAPVLSGVRVTVREAMSNYGLGKGQHSSGLMDRVIERIRFLSRPLLLSLRNTFRRKFRLALTITTLTLGGAIFIAVFNLWAALDDVLVDLEGYFLADVTITYARPFRLQKIEPLAMSVPGVVDVEGWGSSSAQALSDDESTAVEIVFLAPPSDSALISAQMTEGRWLLPTDENAIVIGNHLLAERPDLEVGDEVTIKMRDKEHPWRIVGIYKMVGNVAPPIVYTNGEYLSQSLNEVDMTSELRVTISPRDAASQARVAKALEAQFERAGIQVAHVETAEEWRVQQGASLDLLIYFLLAMAVLIVIVGGLGLMSTMSMNVLERTREIGVMRSIGASSGSVFQIVVVEGMFIGAVSWMLGALLSIPITLLLNQGVGVAIMTAPIDFLFGWDGLVIWLIGALALSALASILPAWNASRLTIREVLAYE